ncbi:hypothetical protein [Christiangramia sabulilitoris]|uniref:Uncharacterized protein n=1 Tax=Christiangramia sabulilitoris TaxID=2583991 RepID=A0A550I7J4_9FLAO|nr:hypothetical protein [Christiangramia sabulilitoris]TRO66943.1 hypothetical protein FGM01_03370 [Christiangramia sabulilitoris]
MLELMVYITAALLTLSKFLDCYSTQLRIRNLNDETNSIGRTFMSLGIKNGIWIIFLISLLIILGSVFLISEYYSTLLYQCLFIITGILVSVVQFAVAHANYYGRENKITRLIRRIHIYKN